MDSARRKQSAAMVAAKEAARVEAEVLREWQLEAYEAFSHYANGYANDDVVRDRQLMPPPPSRPPNTGGTRKRAVLSHGPGSSRAAGADDEANPTGGSNKRSKVLCTVQWWAVPIPYSAIADGRHPGDRAAYAKFGTHWQALEPDQKHEIRRDWAAAYAPESMRRLYDEYP